MHKQYVVMKVGDHHDITPMAGLFPLPIAEEWVSKLREAEPGEKFVIQEVGNA